MRLFRNKPNIGLVLGSGAARGLAHIGAIKALEEENIPVDMIAGTSIGALAGACYAKRRSISDFEEVVLKTDWRRLLQLADLNLAFMFKGFVQGQKVKELLKTVIGDIEFKDLDVPLTVVATDVNTGEEVLIREGPVVEAVRASISIPVIFMPVKFRGRFLIDGGIVNPVPVDAAKKMGATFVIACNVIQAPVIRKGNRGRKASGRGRNRAVKKKIVSDKNAVFTALNEQINTFIRENSAKMRNLERVVDIFKKKIPEVSRETDTPGIFNVLVQVLYAMEYEIVKFKTQEADIMIAPDVGNISALEFYRGEESITEGYKAAKGVISNIRRLTR